MERKNWFLSRWVRFHFHLFGSAICFTYLYLLSALTCPPLTKPANGSVSPAVCLTGDAGPNQHCYFSCDHGFRVTGNPVRSCLPSLKWNPARAPPTCEKGTVHVHYWIDSNFTIAAKVLSSCLHYKSASSFTHCCHLLWGFFLCSFVIFLFIYWCRLL